MIFHRYTLRSQCTTNSWKELLPFSFGSKNMKIFACPPTDDGLFERSDCFGQHGQPKEEILADLSSRCRNVITRTEKLWELQQTVSAFLRLLPTTRHKNSELCETKAKWPHKAMIQSKITASKLRVGPDANSLIRRLEHTYKNGFGRNPPSVRLIQKHEGLSLTKLILSDYRLRWAFLVYGRVSKK